MEKSPFARDVIQQRIRDGHADDAPIHTDIESCDLSQEDIDCYMGGFPCQGVSQAGSQDGLDDDRTGLIACVWKHYDRAVVKPNLD